MGIYYMENYDQPHLTHHGIKGQKWGVRRFQNADGSLKDAGRRRNNSGNFISRIKSRRSNKDLGNQSANKQYSKREIKKISREYKKAYRKRELEGYTTANPKAFDAVYTNPDKYNKFINDIQDTASRKAYQDISKKYKNVKVEDLKVSGRMKTGLR